MKPLPCFSDNGKASVKPDGFTLVEVLATLVIIGILAAIMTFGITRVMEGYLSVRDNTDLSLKGQVALARIVKELRSIDGIDSGNQTSLRYSFQRNGAQMTGRVLSWDGQNGSDLLLGGNVLLDNVNNFAITYFTDYSDRVGTSSWTDQPLIGITLRLNGGQNTVSEFRGLVRPRNLQ